MLQLWGLVSLTVATPRRLPALPSQCCSHVSCLQKRVSEESLGRWGVSSEDLLFHSPVSLADVPGVYWHPLEMGGTLLSAKVGRTELVSLL